MPRLNNIIAVNPGEAFRVIVRSRPGYRESILANFDPALGKSWTVANKTLDRSIDANGVIAVIGDGIASFVDDLKTFMPGIFSRAGSGTATIREQPRDFYIEPGESLRIIQRPGPSSREVVILNLDSATAQAWSTANGGVDRAVNADDAVAGLGDNVATLVDDLKLVFPGMMDHAGTNSARTNIKRFPVGVGGSFKVMMKGDNKQRESIMFNGDADLGNAWTTANVSTSRVVDADAVIAAVADNFCSLVEDMKVWMPAMFNKA
jgi:hypothetical protein